MLKPLFLVGYMGCGKSTVGRKLARRLGVPFVDTDAAVEAREGASVADLFRYEGMDKGVSGLWIMDEYVERNIEALLQAAPAVFGVVPA